MSTGCGHQERYHCFHERSQGSSLAEDHLPEHAHARQTVPLSSNALQEILPKPIDSQVLQEVEAVRLQWSLRLHLLLI